MKGRRRRPSYLVAHRVLLKLVMRNDRLSMFGQIMGNLPTIDVNFIGAKFEMVKQVISVITVHS